MARDFEINTWHQGDGPGIICVHETGTDSTVWQPLADAAAGFAQVVAYDRRGWGDSGEPLGYARTTIAEHSDDLRMVIDELQPDRGAVICGAGLGAVVGLDLALRDPGQVAGLVLVEPPLLALLLEATEAISADRGLIDELAREGTGAIIDAYFDGRFHGLGAGAERIGKQYREATHTRRSSLIAELGAIPAWSLPLAPMRASTTPIHIVTSPTTPDLVRKAADQLALRLANSERSEASGTGLPHQDSAGDLAATLAELI